MNQCTSKAENNLSICSVKSFIGTHIINKVTFWETISWLPAHDLPIANPKVNHAPANEPIVIPVYILESVV